jgi:LuxR family maltose regulon positive regulatory protein
MTARLGDIAAASKWSEGQDPKPSLDVEFVYSPGLGLAEVLIRHGESSSLERAEQLLNTHLGFYSQANRLPLLVETQVLYSLLAHARGDLPSALNHLARSFEMSRAGRFLRVYVDRGPVLVPLLNQLDLDQDGLKYAGEILAAFQNQSIETDDVDQDGTKPSLPAMDVLSQREQQILTLISEHKSNKQIAEELFIAAGTVKRHTENIYQKLGVHKRQDAVTKAEGLGIL